MLLLLFSLIILSKSNLCSLFEYGDSCDGCYYSDEGPWVDSLTDRDAPYCYCATGRPSFDLTACLDDCPSGYGYDSNYGDGEIQSACRPCPVNNCKSCDGFYDGGSMYKCEECEEGYGDHKSRCVKCLDPNCVSCSGATGAVCDSCGLGFAPFAGACMPCTTFHDNCTMCGYTPYVNAHVCFTVDEDTCPEGQTWFPFENKCVFCGYPFIMSPDPFVTGCYDWQKVLCIDGYVWAPVAEKATYGDVTAEAYFQCTKLPGADSEQIPDEYSLPCLHFHPDGCDENGCAVESCEKQALGWELTTPYMVEVPFLFDMKNEEYVMCFDDYHWFGQGEGAHCAYFPEGCSTTIANCESCLDETTCNYCVDDYGTNADYTGCVLCEALHPECILCAEGKCSFCDVGYVIQAGNCSTCADVFGESCTSCADLDPAMCTACTAPKVAYNGVCNDLVDLDCETFDPEKGACTACMSGYYLNGPSCIECSSMNCDECDSFGECTTCMPDYPVLTVNGNCLNCTASFGTPGLDCLDCTTEGCILIDCGEDGFWNGTECNLCEHVIPDCATCTPMVDDHADVMCQTCGTDGCGDCVETYGTGCLYCDVDECLSNNCAVNQLFDPGQGCKNCSVLLTGCVMCDHVDGVGPMCEVCDFGYYVDDSGMCQSCLAGCDLCFGPDICLECEEDKYLLGNTIDNDGFYLDGQFVLNECVACDQDGQFADAAEPAMCYECYAGFYFDSGFCARCPDGCFGDCDATTGHCVACPVGEGVSTDGLCYDCDDLDDNAATCGVVGGEFVPTSCDEGYGLDNDDNCDPCSNMAGCFTCDNATVCNACDDYYQLNPDTKTCTSCGTGCLYCNLDSEDDYVLDECTQCFLGDSEGKGYYAATAKTCTLCGTGCQTCDNSKGETVDAANGECQECEDTFRRLPDKKCYAPDDVPNGGVAECVRVEQDDSIFTCRECVYGKYPQPDQNTGFDVCVECGISNCKRCSYDSGEERPVCDECNEGYLVDFGVCRKCPENCNENSCFIVQGAAICDWCSEGFFLMPSGVCTDVCFEHNGAMHFGNPENDMCVKMNDCEDGDYADLATKMCVKCADGCLQCDPITGACMACGPGLLMVADFTDVTKRWCDTECPGQTAGLSFAPFSILDFGNWGESTIDLHPLWAPQACMPCTNNMGGSEFGVDGVWAEHYLYDGCALCSGDGCQACLPGYFLDTELKICQKCSDFIPFCSACLDESTCTDCYDGFGPVDTPHYMPWNLYLATQTSPKYGEVTFCASCYNQITDDYWPHGGCSTECSGPEPGCAADCVDGYYAYDGECVACADKPTNDAECVICDTAAGNCTGCSEGYMVDNHKCVACDDTNCADCTGDVEVCLVCKDTTYLNTTLDECFLCTDFHADCTECTEAGCSTCSSGVTHEDEGCVLCYPGQVISAAGDECLNFCPAGTYEENGQCQTCGVYTGIEECTACHYDSDNGYNACDACSGDLVVECVQNVGCDCVDCASNMVSGCVACTGHKTIFGYVCVECAATHYLTRDYNCREQAGIGIEILHCAAGSTNRPMSCETCDPGYYKVEYCDGNGCSAGCQSCAATHNPVCTSCSAAQCEGCAEGFILDFTGQCSTCDDFIDYCDECDTLSVCTKCAEGYTVVSNQCQACSVDIAGCLECDSTTVCTKCDVNGYALYDDGCLATCPKDMYKDGDECAICPGGRNTADVNNNLAGCLCPATMTSFDVAADPCTLCELGKYKSGLGDGVCTACLANEYTASVGSETAADCLCVAGWFLNDAATPVCEECPVGKFKDWLGDDACTDCPAHSTTADVGATSLHDCICVAKYYLSAEHTDADTTGCAACPKGRKKAGDGNEECAPCGPGKKCNGGIESDCEAGTYNPTNGVVDICTPCPAGFFCPASTSTPTKCEPLMWCPVGSGAEVECDCNGRGNCPEAKDKCECLESLKHDGPKCENEFKRHSPEENLLSAGSSAGIGVGVGAGVAVVGIIVVIIVAIVVIFLVLAKQKKKIHPGTTETELIEQDPLDK